MSEPIIELSDVCVDYHLDEGVVHAVRGASYELFMGETLGLVGESGCGKSQSSYAAIGLVQPPGTVTGEILFRPEPDQPPIDLLKMKRNSPEIREIRGGRISMIFQEPMSSLSPVHRIGKQIDETLKLHTGPPQRNTFRWAMRKLGPVKVLMWPLIPLYPLMYLVDRIVAFRGERLDRLRRRRVAVEFLAKVGIPDTAKRYRQYSFEFSGGMRQRIMIAIALSCNPMVLFADEPTTGLDVTIQAQILELINALQRQTQLGVVLITHDLAVVAERADRVAVMYLGRIVELADVYTLFASPKHPYTTALLRSVIGSPLAADGRLATIRGVVPGPLERVSGCPFHPRCDHYMPGLCDKIEPDFAPADEKTHVACHLYNEHGKAHKQCSRS
ncbi:MAG TPA: ABC transporter ATP-binding protein [Phycisphaerae bacterium]|nr:ABC transporter ATP-binding protein [Phycisphaerae bacterium]